MKKRSYSTRLGVLALALTLITTCLVGSTMAKYVSEVKGTATAAVAAWSFDVKDRTATKLTTIDLGSTTYRDAYTEKTIKADVIAPGTKGSFDIVIDGTGSEVGIDYAVKIAAAENTTLPTDLTFTTDGSNYDLGSNISGTIDYNSAENQMKKTITINWEWPYSSASSDKDSNDTTFAGKSWNLDITVTGTQTAPTAAPAT